MASGLLATGLALGPNHTHDRLLLAPMLGVMDSCIRAGRHEGDATAASVVGCGRDDGSAAALIESTLAELGPLRSPDGRFEVGYTLQIPLLQLFEREPGNGDPVAAWVIDRRAVRRIVQTLRDSDRPAIVYLFSTHFGIGAPIEPVLAQDPANLAVTSRGPMPPDKYYSLAVYPWSVARTDNPITRRRAEAIDAVLSEICRLPTLHRAKIRGLTLLGELHHLFPDFEAGMGFAPPYLVSDYSAASVTDFRRFLAQRFGSIGALNAQLATDFASFEQVDPPSKDLRTQPDARWFEHIDSFAQGTLPISGWAARQPEGGPAWVRIHRDGQAIARVSAHLSRQDVLAARPDLGTADVGWRHDLDFSKLGPGAHRIDLLLEQPSGEVVPLGTRHVFVMSADQRTVPPAPAALPPASKSVPATSYFIDQPANGAAYWFNPLVPLWHAFRNAQVVSYLDHFDRQVGNSCLWNTPRYIHQIVPHPNPGWDANKFAVDASLHATGGLRLGASLYGEPTYGATFFDRLKALHEDRYGVTEFHPLRGMVPAAVGAMLERHRAHGARFVSFFLEPRWHGGLLPGQRNPFAFDPENPTFGSDALYRSIRELMHE